MLTLMDEKQLPIFFKKIFRFLFDYDHLVETWLNDNKLMQEASPDDTRILSF